MLPQKDFVTQQQPQIADAVTVSFSCKKCIYTAVIVCPRPMVQKFAPKWQRICVCGKKSVTYTITDGFTHIADRCYDGERQWAHLGEHASVIEVKPGIFEKFPWLCYRIDW